MFTWDCVALGGSGRGGHVGAAAKRGPDRGHRITGQRIAAELGTEPHRPLALTRTGLGHRYRAGTRMPRCDDGKQPYGPAAEHSDRPTSQVTRQTDGVHGRGQRLDQRRPGVTEAGRDDVEPAGRAMKASAIAPAVWQPTTRRRSQMLYRPDWQYAHSPQTRLGSRMTRVPGAGAATPGPAASTTPTTSCPGTHGSEMNGCASASACRSDPQMPTTWVRTLISPGPGTGSSASLTSTTPGDAMTTWRNVILRSA